MVDLDQWLGFISNLEKGLVENTTMSDMIVTRQLFRLNSISKTLGI